VFVVHIVNQEEVMTERMVEELHHDLWGISKSITPMSPEDTLEAWRKTVEVLEALCPLADALGLEPLLLAFTDATDWADEELARARDRVERPEGVKISSREDERLGAMLARSDALNNALATIEDHPCPSTRAQQQMLEVLGELQREASEAFERYRREVGLPE
jgi:hypothetical protein